MSKLSGSFDRWKSECKVSELYVICRARRDLVELGLIMFDLVALAWAMMCVSICMHVQVFQV